jgi:hypothetical protein
MGKSVKKEEASKKSVKKAPLSAEDKKAAKKARLENAGPKIVQMPLSVQTGTEDKTKTGKANPKVHFEQHVSHVRGTGCLVTTTILNSKGEAVGGNAIWIPGLKPKSKSGERFLVQDKGPKPKKEKTEKKKK